MQSIQNPKGRRLGVFADGGVSETEAWAVGQRRKGWGLECLHGWQWCLFTEPKKCQRHLKGPATLTHYMPKMC